MQNDKLLQKLTNFEATGFPFISVYLNTEPNEHGKTTFDVFLRKQISQHAEDYETHSSEKESFDQDVQRINDRLESLRPSTRGVAVFASSGADGFFQAREYEVPFDDNYFFIFDKPHLYPLARLLAGNPTYAVVLADTNAAHIYTFGRGRVLEKEEIENTKTNRTEVGGWSQMRYQRHIDNFHHQHAKEVVEELAKIVRDEKIESIVLAGDETVIVPILRQELTPELNEKVAGVLRLNIDTPEHQLFEETEATIKQFEAARNEEKINRLFEENYDGGLGVTGVEETLTALSNGQVQELYLSAGINNIRYDRKKVEQVLADYAPGEDAEPANIRKAVLLVDELIRKGLNSADNIRFIDDENLLKKAGGIGALLRYNINNSVGQA